MTVLFIRIQYYIIIVPVRRVCVMFLIRVFFLFRFSDLGRHFFVITRDDACSCVDETRLRI